MRVAVGILALCVAWAVVSAFGGADMGCFALAMHAPTSAHWMGCDALGRDLFWRVGAGVGLSLWVGLWASAVAMIIGTLYGSAAALAGGKTDKIMMRMAEIVSALPLVLFVVLVCLYVGRSLVALFVALGAIEWTTLARLVRAQLLKIRSRDFVAAAQSMGASPARIFWRHFLPHTLGVVLSYALLNLPALLILEATLSYLGLGVQPPQASLGVLLKEGAEAMSVAPWLLWAPAAAFVAVLGSVMALGERLKESVEAGR